MRLIDADALKDAIQDHFDNLDAYFPSAFIKEVEEAPTVEPDKVLVANVTFDEDKLKDIVQTEVIEKIKSGELVIKDERPQGEWIYHERKNELLRYKCNQCGVYHSPTNYCPCCGAKMKGGAE